MKINIKATGIELTPDLSHYIEKRLATLEKHLQNTPAALVEVEVGRSTQHHQTGRVFRAEIHVSGQGLDLYVATEEADTCAAIDVAKDEIIHKLTHEKGKREALYRRGARRVKDMMRGLNPFKKRP